MTKIAIATGEVHEQHDEIQSNKTEKCLKSNSRYGIGGTAAGLCTNKYVECENNIATEKICPDGFYFNEKITIDKYPCQHLINANCTLQTAMRPPQVCVHFSNHIYHQFIQCHCQSPPQHSNIFINVF